MDPADDVGIDLEMNEEIIELDEVVELPGEMPPDGGDEEMAEKVPKPRGELDLSDLDLEFDSEEGDLLKEDLLSGLSFDDEQPEGSELEDVDLSEGEPLEDIGTGVAVKDENDVPASDLDREEPIQEGPLERGADVAMHEGVEGTDTVEEFALQIEERLMLAVRQMVESRLPDIVREILSEEIERLKEEIREEK